VQGDVLSLLRNIDSVYPVHQCRTDARSEITPGNCLHCANIIYRIYSLIRFLRIKPYDDYTTFNRDFGIPFRSKSNWQIKEAMPKFQALLKAMLLRRTKASQIDGKPILTLPPKTIETKHCVFSQEEQEFYSALRNKTMIQFNKYLRANAIGKNYSNILVLLLRLRQAACHPHLINDIEHNAGEVEAGQMVELAKGLSRAVVTRLKETGIEECPSGLAIYLCHMHRLTKV